VRHSYAPRRYIVMCEVSDCNWRVCALKQKATRKFNITKVAGPHPCAQTELNSKHRQLTSTLIAKRLLVTLNGQPKFKVKSIMTMTWEVLGYRIKYGNTWRAKQRAWEVIHYRNSLNSRRPETNVNKPKSTRISNSHRFRAYSRRLSAARRPLSGISLSPSAADGNN
jgi:hypothetical protein